MIELMIVFSILAILSTVGVAAFVSFSRTQTLNAAAGDIKSMLNLGKSRAYSQVKPSTPPCNTNQLDRYQVKICKIAGVSSGVCINTEDADYELDVRCGGNYVSPPIKTGKLPGGYRIENSPSTFSFPVLTGGIIFDGGSYGMIGIKNTQTNQSAIITVGKDGSIK